MLDKLKGDLVTQMKEVSKDGVKPANIEYISKMAETYKNLNKAEKEEVEKMMFDQNMDSGYGRRYRDGDGSYRDGNGSYRNDGGSYRNGGMPYREVMPYDGYGRRGRGEYANRDSMGRYANGNMRYMEDGYADYMGAKRRYRDGNSPKEDMYDGLELLMKHITALIEDIYKDCDGEEEKRIMDKYLRKLSELR